MVRRSPGSTAEISAGEVIAQRYRVIDRLGSGGVGEVLAVFDETTMKPRALKRLLSSTDERVRELLEGTLRREYAILAQFAHPHVVEVFDFGFDDGRAFYTMEHLVGAHPGDSGPMAWRDVCRMLVTLCGPLVLLHSRGWVHRDLSPRNVFLVDAAGAKLLDFGAMAALDEAHSPMGATPCLAPETLRRERIDARTDLFGLGALGYFALTGRHAYPARDLAHLSQLWKSSPPRPRELVKDIPEALDELILALLSLDMQARPRQLAEVVARLIAVAELPDDGTSTLLQACLTTPGLLGRDAELERLKGLLLTAAEGRGTRCIVRGPSGSGRTRLLDALAVEAEVCGHRVIRAEGALSGTRSFGLLRELGRAGEAGEELERAAVQLDQDPRDEELAQQLQAAFYAAAERWGSRAQPALIMVDDCDLADAESLKLLAGLQRTAAAPWQSMVLASRSERKELRDAEVIELQPLTAAQIEQLMQALFGEVPNLARLSHWLQRHSGGLPGACMLAARDLVERGRATFVSGSWQLPEVLDDLQLSAAEQAIVDRKLSALSQPARAWLELLALVTEPSPLPTSQYWRALRLTDAHAAIAEGELLAIHAFIAHDGSYTVRDRQLLRRAREHRLAIELQALHAQLGHFYAAEGKALYAAYHFWEAKLVSEADAQIDAALSVAGVSVDRASSVFSYSRGVRDLYEGLLAYRKQRGAAPLELYPLRMALLAIASMSDASCGVYVPETLAQLRFDVGLDLIDADSSKPALERALQGLGRAQERYAALPPEQRGLSLDAAIPTLTQAVAALTGVFTATYDAVNLSWLPALITPLRSLAPALEWVASLAEQTADAVIYNCDSRESNHRILGLTEHEMAGVSDTLRHNSRSLVLYYLGMQEAQEGQDSALQRAAQLQAAPAYEVLGLSVLRMYALAHGRFDEAQHLRRERELVPWHSVTAEHHLQNGLLRESGTMFDCHDLLELTRVGVGIREMANRFPGWKPWDATCRAFCHLVADEPAAALSVCNDALQTFPPFGHGAFQHLTQTKAWAEVELGLYAEAERTARELSVEIARRGLRLDRPYQLETVLAVAEAGIGAREAALTRLDTLLKTTEARLGPNVLAYGRLCEARCQAALLLDDAPGFFEHLERMQPIYAEHPSLRAQHARWARAGHEQFARPVERQSESNWTNRIAHALSLHALEEHGDYLLSIVLDELALEVGLLLRAAGRESLQLMASRPGAPDTALLMAAQARWKNWESDSDCETMIGDAQLELRDSQGRSYCALWLNHAAGHDRPVGLLLLACTTDRLGQLSQALLRAISQHLG
ncbi:MAG TPA: AAA family ATPase [Polyangiales bacterium]|nr:AAA family ATPase [Polyangiales bacterium]